MADSPEAEAAADGASSDAAEVEASAGGEAEAEEKKKPQKWTCSSCGAKNFASVTECHKCGSRQPSQAEASLMAERDAAKAEVASVMDDFLRLQADLQNYRRQHNESMVRAQQLGRQDALRQLVPLVEDITEAIDPPADMADTEKPLFDSYSLLFKKVADAYGKFGVDVMETAAGEKFDPLKHRKVEEREAPGDEAPGTILEVLKTGWNVDGRVLIPSEVAIVASPEPEPEEEDEEEEEEMEEDEFPEEESKEEEAKEEVKEEAKEEATDSEAKDEKAEEKQEA